MWIVASSAAALTVCLFLSLWLRLGRLGLLDLFLLGIAAYFGVYTLVDLATVEHKTDPIAAIVVFLPIMTTALILWLLARRQVFPMTSLARLQQDGRDSSGLGVIILICLCLSYRWFTLRFFSEFETFHEIEAADVALPYWYTSMESISATAVFVGGLSAWWKATATHGTRKLFWLILTAASLLMILGTGRRALFAFLVMVGWTILQGMGRKRIRAIALLLLSVPLLVVASNLFQAYRMVSYRGVVLDASEVTLTTALEVDRTVSNLQERQAIWRLNYEVADSHFRGNGALQLGRLFAVGIPNYIPAALYPGKKVIEVESELLETFNLQPYDRAGNVFVYTYADFGLTNIVVAPALFLLFVAFCSAVLRYMSDPFLRLTLMGFAVYYALNMEANYLTPLQMTRDYVAIALVYLVGRTALKSCAHLMVYVSRTVGKRRANDLHDKFEVR